MTLSALTSHRYQLYSDNNPDDVFKFPTKSTSSICSDERLKLIHQLPCDQSAASIVYPGTIELHHRHNIFGRNCNKHFIALGRLMRRKSFFNDGNPCIVCHLHHLHAGNRRQYLMPQRTGDNRLFLAVNRKECRTCPLSNQLCK